MAGWQGAWWSYALLYVYSRLHSILYALCAHKDIKHSAVRLDKWPPFSAMNTADLCLHQWQGLQSMWWILLLLRRPHTESGWLPAPSADSVHPRLCPLPWDKQPHLCRSCEVAIDYRRLLPCSRLPCSTSRLFNFSFSSCLLFYLSIQMQDCDKSFMPLCSGLFVINKYKCRNNEVFL